MLGQAASDRLFEGSDPVGQRVSPDGGQTWATVVGVVGDVRQTGFDADVNEEVYFSYWQGGFARRLLVRTAGDPTALARVLTEDVYAVDPNQPVSFVQTLADAESERVASPRTITALLGIFAAVALITAAFGILSVIAFTTSQRKREIGIRLALGGERRDVLLMVLRSGLAMTAVGLAIGGTIALFMGDLLDSFLFGLSSTDPLTLGAVSAVLLAAAALATLVPAWRGTSVNPVDAFKAE